MDDDEIIPTEKFEGTTTDIIMKNHRTCGCQIYVLDEKIQGNLAGLPRWEP